MKVFWFYEGDVKLIQIISRRKRNTHIFTWCLQRRYVKDILSVSHRLGNVNYGCERIYCAISTSETKLRCKGRDRIILTSAISPRRTSASLTGVSAPVKTTKRISWAINICLTNTPTVGRSSSTSLNRRKIIHTRTALLNAINGKILSYFV